MVRASGDYDDILLLLVETESKIQEEELSFEVMDVFVDGEEVFGLMYEVLYLGESGLTVFEISYREDDEKKELTDNLMLELIVDQGLTEIGVHDIYIEI